VSILNQNRIHKTMFTCFYTSKGLEPSPEFLELVEKEKRGEITTNDIIKTLNEKYKMKEERNGDDA
jgi:hypothetical protein